MLIPSRWCCHPICLKNHFEPPSKKNVICIPLCNGVHFQVYIVNIKEHKNNSHRFTLLGPTEKSNLFSNCKNAV